MMPDARRVGNDAAALGPLVLVALVHVALVLGGPLVAVEAAVL